MPTTATPYKEFFPFDDYAKKGIVQVRLEDENHDAITGIMPESIKYGINNSINKDNTNNINVHNYNFIKKTK